MSLVPTIGRASHQDQGALFKGALDRAKRWHQSPGAGYPFALDVDDDHLLQAKQPGHDVADLGIIERCHTTSATTMMGNEAFR